MSNPKVSICIPCHNAGDYLEATLDSLLAQTYDNIEIIVTNDASTDQSKEILDRHQKDHDLIVVTERYWMTFTRRAPGCLFSPKH